MMNQLVDRLVLKKIVDQLVDHFVSKIWFDHKKTKSFDSIKKYFVFINRTMAIMIQNMKSIVFFCEMEFDESSMMLFIIQKTMNTIVDDGSIGRSFGFLSKSWKT